MIPAFLLFFLSQLAYVPHREVVEPECTEENPCHGESHHFWDEEEDEFYERRNGSEWPGKRDDPLMSDLIHQW